MHHVNPEFRATLQAMEQQMSSMPAMSAASLPEMRKMFAQMAPAPLPAPAVQEKMVPGLKDNPAVRVFVIGAAAGARKPAVLHIHGGGYVTGSPATDLRALQGVALAHDCVCVSVDYRLAPETRFPGSLEDNYAALKWLHDNADSLGVDTTRIAIKGESAGGGHAAALAIAARDRGEVPICLQVLIYPMLDDRTASTRQVPAQFGRYIWKPESNRFGWSSLLGVPAGSANVPKGSVPARVANVLGLPPTFIGVGSIDLFCEEDIAYGRRFIDAGISAELLVVPGAFHGFDVIVPEARLSQSFNKAWNAALARAFTRP